MDLGLKGKTALLAAASQGLGYGVAHAMAADGAHVSICSRREDAITEAAARLAKETHAETLGVACDVKDPTSIQNWVGRTVQKWGKIDALLVNAGGPPGGKFKDFGDDHWQSAFELTLMSAVRLIRAALPHMPHGSAILVITSSSVVEPIEGLILSTVMRSGVTGLIKALADELAPDGIRINNLVPGRIDTERVKRLDEMNATKRGISVQQIQEGSIAKIPLKRLGTADEFGAAGAFLLSPAASYITGAILRVDGGSIRSI